MSSFVNKMLKQQGYKLPETVNKKVPDNPNDTLTVRYLKNAGFNGPQQAEKEDTEVDTPEEQPKTITGRLLKGAGFDGIPAGGDRSSTTNGGAGYSNGAAQVTFNV